MSIKFSAIALGTMLALGTGVASAAAPADWSKVAAKKITVFYPGVSPIEWITKGSDHGGARLLKKGETCVGCHEEELADMGQKMASGSKIEPTPIAGKAPAIPVNVQAAHDGENLYLRFSWKEPKASGAAKMDADNQVKLAVMLEANKVERADQSGCWETCHGDARTMPGADDKKTKYVKGGDLASGKFYDLIQWRSGKGEMHDGYVADKR
ncbi:MAG: ethylbenzene dehydrogenase-related protein, partial [Rhodocyclaceae bacterium]